MSDKHETRAARATDELADVADLAAAGEPIDDADALRALARIAEHIEERLRACADGLEAGLGEARDDRAADGDEGHECIR